MDDIPWGAGHPHYLDTSEEFFGTDTAADFARWGAVQYWSVEEGIALSFGFDPRVVNARALGGYEGHPFAAEFDRRLDLAKRAVVEGQLAVRSSPKRFMKWAKTVGISFPDKLVHMAGPLAATDPVRTSSASGLTKMVKTDSKITLSIVKEIYGFDPAQPLRDTFAEIAADLLSVGISVEVQALEQFLKKTTDLDDNLTEAHQTLCRVIFGLAVKHFEHDPSASRGDGPQNIAKLMRDLGTPLDVGAIRSRLQWGAPDLMRIRFPKLVSAKDDETGT